VNVARVQGVEGSRVQVAEPGTLGSLATAVSASGLTRVYRRGAERIHALKGIDLEIKSGEFGGVMGHSGAGKTTLLNLLGLMDRPTEGKLEVLGRDVSRGGRGLDALRRRNIGFVFQEFYLMPSLTALENVLMPTMWGRGNDERGTMSAERQNGKDRARELLKMVGLGHRMNHRPSELSGGEMQRVAIARSLINSPRLLLADEPTGNLDTKTRDTILLLLQGLNRDSGLTILVATHDLGLESWFTRVVRLEDGSVR
jgi:ABC-type lipoprotein export system ATPase subunit